MVNLKAPERRFGYAIYEFFLFRISARRPSCANNRLFLRVLCVQPFVQRVCIL